MREFLKGLDLDKEVIDTIMAEYGKNVQGLKEQVSEYKDQVTDYKSQIADLSSKAKTNQDVQKEIDDLNKKIADYEQKEADRIAREKAENEDKTLTNNILNVFGDKKFTSEYAKNGLMNDIKAELNKEENKGLGIQEIFDNLTKDKQDIFANPNQFKDMEGMGDTDTNVSKEVFDKMSYNQRVEFKHSNPELFEKYNN